MQTSTLNVNCRFFNAIGNRASMTAGSDLTVSDASFLFPIPGNPNRCILDSGWIAEGLTAGGRAAAELILTGERPSDCAVGDGLMDGARFMIYVPHSAVDSYRRNYFWQAYSA